VERWYREGISEQPVSQTQRCTNGKLNQGQVRARGQGKEKKEGCQGGARETLHFFDDLVKRFLPLEERQAGRKEKEQTTKPKKGER